MNTSTLIVLAVIVVILSLSAGYIIKAKKGTKKCIGCPDAKNCASKNCINCQGNCNNR